MTSPSPASVQETSAGLAAATRSKWPTGQFLLGVYGVCALLAPGAATTNLPRPFASEVRSFHEEDLQLPTDPDVIRTAEEPDLQNFGQEIRDLHATSGLTWEQLARLFGVSRRSMHHWANGGNMTARNAEMLAELHRNVKALSASEPAGRRSQLLRPDANGDSIYERLLAHVRDAGTVIDGSYLRPEYLLGIQNKSD